MRYSLLVLGIVLVSCTQLPAPPAGIPAGNDSFLVPPKVVGNHSFNDSDDALRDLLVKWIESDEVNLSNSSRTFEAYGGSGVEFYISTIEGLVRDRLSEGESRMYDSSLVNVSFLGMDSEGNVVMFRVNNESSDVLREKESDVVGGKFIYVMEVSYR